MTCDVLRVGDVARSAAGRGLRRRACWNDWAVSPRNEDHDRDATGLRAEAPRCDVLRVDDVALRARGAACEPPRVLERLGRLPQK